MLALVGKIIFKILPTLVKNSLFLPLIFNFFIDTISLIVKSLYSNISKNNLGSVSDVTDQFVMINLEGKKIFELLSSGCPLNLNEFKEKKGSTAQTILNHMDVVIHHKNSNNVNLFVKRSFSEHLWSWINDAASRL